jgi:hypothetical protein
MTIRYQRQWRHVAAESQYWVHHSCPFAEAELGAALYLQQACDPSTADRAFNQNPIAQRNDDSRDELEMAPRGLGVRLSKSEANSGEGFCEAKPREHDTATQSLAESRRESLARNETGS